MLSLLRWLGVTMLGKFFRTSDSILREWPNVRFQQYNNNTNNNINCYVLWLFNLCNESIAVNCYIVLT